MLMNYQKALMKPYYDTRLKSLAQAAGYPVAAIQSCSQFQRTHRFILEAWEAMYRVMILKHIQHCKENASSLPDTLIQEIIQFVQTKPHNHFPRIYNKHLQSKSRALSQYLQEFRLFVQESARKNDTWRFWAQFVFEDAMAYISLFLAIRSGDWNLRMASMKSIGSHLHSI